MRVTVRYFAGHRDITGQSSEHFDLAEAATIESLWKTLTERYPRLAAYTGRVLYAVNEEFATLPTLLHDGDEVAFIPPVSGGNPANPPFFLVTDQPLDADSLNALVQSADIGAIVTFAGVVRNHFEGRATAYLEYEAYQPMAERVLAQLAAEAQAHWQTGAIAIHHRIGKLHIGETAVLIIVASAHRQAAFEATAWLMDRIKALAPIWKKEYWADGVSEWVEERGLSNESAINQRDG